MIYLEKTRLVVLTLAIGLGLSMQKDPSADAPGKAPQSAMGLQLVAPPVLVGHIDPVACHEPQTLTGQLWLFPGPEAVKHRQWHHHEDVFPRGCQFPGDDGLRDA